MAGKKAKCPRCGMVLRVPQAAATGVSDVSNLELEPLAAPFPELPSFTAASTPPLIPTSQQTYPPIAPGNPDLDDFGDFRRLNRPRRTAPRADLELRPTRYSAPSAEAIYRKSNQLLPPPFRRSAAGRVWHSQLG